MNRAWVILCVILASYAVATLACAAVRKRKRRCMDKSASEAMRLSAGAPAPMVASCGTLLGAVRAGAIVPDDDDVDLHVMPGDWDAVKDYVVDSYDRGTFRHVWRDGGTTLTLRCKGCGPLASLDIYRIPEASGTPPTYEFFGTRMSESSVAPGDRVGFEGGELTGPRDPTSFLETMYGSTWRTPRYLGKGNTKWRPIDVLHAIRRGGKKVGLYV